MTRLLIEFDPKSKFEFSASRYARFAHFLDLMKIIALLMPIKENEIKSQIFSKLPRIGEQSVASELMALIS